MNRRNALLIVTVGMILILSAGADQRQYVWTYEYFTMPKKEIEIEYYLTFKKPHAAIPEIASWEHQIEIEYGITPKWDIAIYQSWLEQRSADTASFFYDGFKLRNRFRLLERGEFYIDPLLYVEYKRKTDLTVPDILEIKIIVSRYINNFDISYNQTWEYLLGGEKESSSKYAIGCGVRATDGFHFGIESIGNYNKKEYFGGVTISIPLKDDTFFSFGTAWGLNDHSPDFQSRMIMGYLL